MEDYGEIYYYSQGRLFLVLNGFSGYHC